MTRKKFIGACLFWLAVCAPGKLPGQEALPPKTLSGHNGAVNTVAFSPDGKLLASGGVDGSVELWSVEAGSRTAAFEGHKSYVNSVAFSPDGKYLVSASADKTIKIWDLADGSCVKTLAGHKDYVWAAAFFPDGERIASGGDDRTVRLWRVKDGKNYKILRGHTGYIHSLSISSDGRFVASGGTDALVKIWDAGSGKCAGTLAGHKEIVNSVSFAPGGDYLASGSEDGTIKIWRLSDNQAAASFYSKQQSVLSLGYSPDGNTLFSGGGDNTVTVWNTADWNPVVILKGHSSAVKAVAVSPDGKHLASGSFDSRIKLWLTPEAAASESKQAQKATEAESEGARKYGAHFAAGLQAMSSPTALNKLRAAAEFRIALYYKPNKVCEEKFDEAYAAAKPLLKNILVFLLASAAFLFLYSSFSKFRAKVKARRTLPAAIKKETLLGNYERAMDLYNEYKSINGKPQNLPREEMLELYRGRRALEELAAEDLPGNFLVYYAGKFSAEGNHRTALSLFHSGRLLDEFKLPGDFDAFVDVYRKAGKPENYLMLKLGPAVFSNLAEAFLRAGDYAGCGKACGLKKQFYGDKLSARDNELLALCRQKEREAGEVKAAAAVLKWKCIGCGYVHDQREAPDFCPVCSHPKEHFQAITAA